jgi:chromosome segregation ATPase
MLKLVWSSKWAAMKNKNADLQLSVDSLSKELNLSISQLKQERARVEGLDMELRQTRQQRDGALYDVKLLKEELRLVKRENEKCKEHRIELKDSNLALSADLESKTNAYSRSIEIIQAQEEGMKKLNDTIAKAVHLLNLNRGGRTSKRTLEAKQILEAHLKQAKDV